nr:septation protein IspZ [uncultured Gellertiella sp.]
MRIFLSAAGLLVVDMASSLLFVLLFSLTRNLGLSVGLAMALGVGQIGVQLFRRKPIHSMEWLSLALVISSGTASLLTQDARFLLLKPSVIYAIVGIAMLKPGWMVRYLPPIARQLSRDIAVRLGFAWAGLMFVSAVVNLVLAVQLDVATWASVMTAFGIVSKALLFVLGYGAIRIATRRRLRAMPAGERESVLAAHGFAGDAKGA